MSRWLSNFVTITACTAVLAMFFTGCSGSPPTLEAGTATESLRRALDLWKSGAPLEQLQQDTQIIMSDVDWKAGKKLADYKIVNEKATDGFNLHATVELTLANEKTSKSLKPKSVTYIVGTDPVVTIHRDE